jgi:hypothetical protein
MTFSWGGGAAPRAEVDEEARARLARIADALIPAAHGMPAASEVGVAAGQLDAVLHARPDLLTSLRRALTASSAVSAARGDSPPTPPADEVEAHLAALSEADPEAHHALVLVVLAGYYWSDTVKERLGYPGQTAAVVSTAFPAYIEEGLLDPVLERGEIYRLPPEG